MAISRRTIGLHVEVLEVRITPSFTNTGPFAAGVLPIAELTADFNNDGIPDLAFLSGETGAVTVLLGDGTGQFTPAPGSGFVGDPAAAPDDFAVGDFNNDGNLDFVLSANLITDPGELEVFFGDGAGNFSAGPITNVFGSAPAKIVAGQFSADANEDVAIIDSTNNAIVVLTGNGAGNFTPTNLFPAGNGPIAFTTGDFNNDGFSDLAVIAQGDGQVRINLGNGDGTFEPVPKLVNVGTSPTGIAVGNFNFDGFADLAVTDSSGSVYALLGDGTGNFTVASVTSTGTGTQPGGVVVADFNNDGVPDLATFNPSSNNVSVLAGVGDGTFTAFPQSPYAVGGVPSALVTNDFNRDGLPDLAVALQDSDSVLVMLDTAPTITSVSVSPTALNEGQVATLTVSFSEAGSHAFTATVNWGDASADSSTSIPVENTQSFTLSHLYADDNPTGTPSDVNTIVVTLEDDDDLATFAQTPITVNNVAPALTGVSLAPTTISENQTATLTVSFTDAGLQDTFTSTVDWGDGTTSSTTIGTGTTTAHSFTISHQYLDDNPTDTPSDANTVVVTVADDDTGTGSGSATITVNNVAPSAGPGGKPEPGQRSVEYDLDRHVQRPGHAGHLHRQR